MSYQPQWGSYYLGGVCAFNGAIAKALSQSAAINFNWAHYQLNMLLKMLHLSMVHGSQIPFQSLQKLYNQTLELIKGLQSGTLKPGAALNQKLKTLTEGIEGVINCIPEPVKPNLEAAKSGPVAAMPGPLLPTGIVLLYPEMTGIPPDLPLVPQGFGLPLNAMPGQPTVPSEPEPEPKEPGFSPYSPYVQVMCKIVQKAIKMINAGVKMMNVLIYLNSSVGNLLDHAMLTGNMSYYNEILKLQKLIENLPTPSEFMSGWQQGKYEELKADILKILQDAGLAVCLEIPPMKPLDSSDLDYVSAADFPLLPWSPEETVGEPAETPMHAFPLNIGGIETSVVAIPLYVPPPKPEEEEKPINPYNPVLPGLCSGVQHLIDLLNEGKLNLYYGMGYVHSMILPPLLMALSEAKAQGNQAKYDELMKIYKLFFDLPTPQEIQYSVHNQFQAKEMLAKVLAQLEAITDAICLEKPPLHIGFTPDKVKQTTPVGVGGVVAIAVLGICGLIGCGVTVFAGLPLVGIELPSFGPTACPGGECASEIGTLECGAACDPEIGGCADGLTCALLGYQGAGAPPRTVCWDSAACSDGTHQAGSCWAPCIGSDTSAVQCDAGLSCTLWGSPTNGSYVCFSAEACQTVTPTASSGQPALPQNPCKCEGVDYICKNSDGSAASASYNSTQCGGSGNCECRGQDLFCPDGSYGQFNPACMGGGEGCQCIYTDPCTGGMAGCPGYYDTCSGNACRP